MENLNDMAYFVSVVEHGGFSAAARATGIEKTRLSRRVSALENRLGVRLLQRNTRHVALTDAGERFFIQARTLMEGARSALESVADLRREPAGTVRLSCPQIMAQSYLAPILPGYLAAYPRVILEVDASDRPVDLLRERFDLALRAHHGDEAEIGLVARSMGQARRVLVASAGFLNAVGRPRTPNEITGMDTFSRAVDVHDGKTRWTLADPSGRVAVISHTPRLVTDDLRMQLQAAVHGMGIALLPEPIISESVRRGMLEIVIPQWSAEAHVINLLYPPPRGMLPSVRSLIDYLTLHLPACIQERSIDPE